MVGHIGRRGAGCPARLGSRVASDDARALSAWVEAVARELGLEGALDGVELVDTVLDLTSDVAHGVSRPGAPVTAFLIGVAAGRADDPAVPPGTTPSGSAGWRASWDAPA